MAEIGHQLQNLKGNGWQHSHMHLRKLGYPIASDIFLYFIFSVLLTTVLWSLVMLSMIAKECNKWKPNKHHLLTQNFNLSLFSMYHEKNMIHGIFSIVYKLLYTGRLWIHVALLLQQSQLRLSQVDGLCSAVPCPDQICIVFCIPITCVNRAVCGP